MADKISALIFKALASDGEKPRASKMFPLTIWVGLFSAALFMCPLLLQSLLHPFQSLLGHLDVTDYLRSSAALTAVSILCMDADASVPSEGKWAIVLPTLVGGSHFTQRGPSNPPSPAFS